MGIFLFIRFGELIETYIFFCIVYRASVVEGLCVRFVFVFRRILGFLRGV